MTNEQLLDKFTEFSTLLLKKTKDGVFQKLELAKFENRLSIDYAYSYSFQDKPILIEVCPRFSPKSVEVNLEKIKEHIINSLEQSI